MFTEKEQNILRQFKTIITTKFPGEISEILIFGSKARSDSKEDSDVDILVITESEDWNLMRSIRDIAYDLELENEVILSIQIFSKSYTEFLRSFRSQFINNVDRESVVL